MFTIRRLIYLILVTCVAFAAHVFFYHAEKYWMTWAILALALIPFNLTFRKRLQLSLISGVSFAICVFITSLFVLPLWQVAIFLVIIAILNVLIAETIPQFYLSALVITLFAIMGHLTAVPLTDNVMRFLFILLGALTVLFAQLIFWPYCFQFEISGSMRMVLKQLAKLNNEFYSCYLEPAYKENLYLFERRLHRQKNRYLIAMQEFNKVIAKKNHHLKNFQQQFERLFELILDQAQIRWRVKDHTIFDLCRNELLSLASELENIFAELAAGLHQKKYHIDIQGLNEKIKRFEENYQTVLQVASREPLVFALFIANLKEMSAEISILCKNLLDEKLIENTMQI